MTIFKHISGVGNIPLTPVEEAEFNARNAAEQAAAPQKAYDKKLKEILQDFDKQVDILTSGYSRMELLSWFRQEEEARNFKENPAYETPLLDRLITKRGRQKQEFVDRVLEKVQSFAIGFGDLLGDKQVRVDALDAIDLTAPDAIDQINGV